MQQLVPDSLLTGKSEDACAQIAQRVGLRLCDEVLSSADRRAAEFLARALVDDAVESVRVELSKVIAHAKHLPRDLALKLAHDVDSVACPFLEVTEVFSDSDWQQLILTISRGACVAVARRAHMSESIASTLAQIGDSIVTETLIENPAAPMIGAVCHTIMERFASEIWVLDKLASRQDLISQIAVELTTIVSAAARKKLETAYNLTDFTEPVAAEAETGALLQIVKKTPKADLITISEELKKRGRLKPSLVLKALQEDHLDFLEAALSVLSGRSLEHVRSVILRAGREAVTQLLEKAQIPKSMHEDFLREMEVVRQKHK
jgi:uncharacterized protein (DUF2336 family)